MHKMIYLLLLFFSFSLVSLQKHPAEIPDPKGICHLPRVPREIRDRIAQFVLYETDKEFVARARADFRKKKDKPEATPLIPALRAWEPSQLKFSPAKTYAVFLSRKYNPPHEHMLIVGPRYFEYFASTPSHTYITAPMIQAPCYFAFNKQRTLILVMNSQEIFCGHSLPDFFLEEKYTGSCAENSLKEFFLRKLVCKRLENSKGTHA